MGIGLLDVGAVVALASPTLSCEDRYSSRKSFRCIRRAYYGGEAVIRHSKVTQGRDCPDVSPSSGFHGAARSSSGVSGRLVHHDTLKTGYKGPIGTERENGHCT